VLQIDPAYFKSSEKELFIFIVIGRFDSFKCVKEIDISLNDAISVLFINTSVFITYKSIEPVRGFIPQHTCGATRNFSQVSYQ
jgi:hypothetical protein